MEHLNKTIIRENTLIHMLSTYALTSIIRCDNVIAVKGNRLHKGGARMKKIVDDSRLIYKCCYLYYMDGLGQKEICDQLGISRATVSRMLKAGKENGVVRIELDNPDSILYGEMERRIEHQLGLKEVLIVDEMELESKEDHMQRVNEEALTYLARIFHNHDYIGVSMGKTLYNLANGKTNVEEVDCTFVPVVGGVGMQLHSNDNYHSNDIVNAFARKFNGSAVQFFAPAVFDDRNIMAGFLKERPVQEVTSLFKKLKTVIMGIGSCSSRESILVKCGYLSKEDYEQFKERGAVGDVLLKFLDKNGNSAQFSEFNERVMGLSDEGLMNIENRIGIAVGEEKSRAILGGIRAKKINILITDISCAKKLLALIEEEESPCQTI